MDFEQNIGRQTEDDQAELTSRPDMAAAGAARAAVLMPNADGVVVLPEGASLDDVTVRGRDLVVDVDGRIYVIPNGAVDVPVLVIEGVSVPPLNLAAYLTGNEPQPAAGTTQSSGGNFADPADPIQAAFGLGDLLPYTELAFPEVVDDEIFPFIDNEPEITFVPRTGEGTEVRESHLPANTPVRSGETPGSQFDGNSETTTNIIDFVSLDGVGSLSINGVVINPGQLPQTVAANGVGTLVITGYTFDNGTKTGSITYQYTLNDNTLDTAGSQVSFPIVLIDTDGDVAEDQLVIRIVDDVPLATPDTNSVSEGGTASGNVLPNDKFGADGAAATTPAGGVIGVRAAGGDTTTAVETGTGTQIKGLYGTLILKADGSYSYKADANIIDTNVKDVFVYSIMDGDTGRGDISTTTLTIDVAAITLVSDNENVVVNEAALDLAKDGADLAAGTVIGRTPSSTAETVSGTISVPGAAQYAIVGSTTGNYGVISIGNDGKFVYTLTRPVDNLPHADDGTETEVAKDVFTYRATDASGNTVTGTITVDIIDDIPVASPDANTVNEGGTVLGNVLPNDVFGADGPMGTSPAGGVIGVRKAGADITTPVTTGTGVEILGDFGKLVLKADGSYTYVSTPGAVNGAAQDVFVYTIQDSDGDRSTTTLTITLNDVTLVADAERVTVFEAALDTQQSGADLAPSLVTGTAPGNPAETVTGALTVTGATNFVILGSTTGNYGLIKLNPDGTYTYTLTRPVDNLPHANDGNDITPAGDVFTYRASDGQGNFIDGTITIDIVDDVPIARPDSNTVAENSSVNGDVDPNDTWGADGPDGGILGVRLANGDTATPVFSGIGATIPGLHGTLVLQANGTYQYTASSVNQTETDVFVYTIRDSDGDLSTTTLTITILDQTTPPPPPPPNLVPTAGTVAVLLDDDVVGSAGNPDGTGDDDPDTVSFPIAANLPGSGGDGTLTWAFNTAGSTIPSGYSFAANPPANTLIIQQGATPIVTIVLNPATGAVQITQNNPADHPDGLDENNANFSIAYTVSDATPDSVGGTLTINLDDDTPVVELTAGETVLIADESVGTTGSTQDEPGDATNNDESGAPAGPPTAIGYATGSLISGNPFLPGADGEQSHSYVLSVTNTTSGLTDTVKNQAVTLSMNGTVVEGKNADGDLVFKIAVDSSGNGTLTQYRAVFHDDTGDHDESGTSAAGLNAGTIRLTASLTDNDNDTADDFVDVSALFRFEDDGPAVTAVAADVSVSVDESDLVQGAGAIAITGYTQGTDSDVAAQPTVIKSATSGSALVTPTADYGSDGAAASNSLVYSFADLGDGATSLTTTEGDAITLVRLSDTVVVGQIGATTQAAFALELNSNGYVKVEQYVSLTHGTPGDGTTPANSHDEPVSLAGTALAIQVTVKDGDGDTAALANPVNIGEQISFEDDGPDAQDDGDNISGGSGPATGNVITGGTDAGDSNTTDGVADDPGVDGAKITKVVSDNDTTKFDDSPDQSGNFSVVGHYGTLTINEDGTYSYQRTDLSPGNKSDSFTYTLTDGDGDWDTAVLTITIGDAAPTGGTRNVLLDDDVVGSAGNLDGTGDDDPDTVSFPLTGTLPGTGGNGALTWAFKPDADQTKPTGYTYNISGSTLVIKQGTTDIVTIVLNDPSAGAYKITQNNPADHPDGLNENNQPFTVKITVTDEDGDPADVTLTLDLDDDTPVVDLSAGQTALIADESVGTTGSTQDEGGRINNDETGAPAGPPTAIGYATGSLISGNPFSAGADGEKSHSFALSVTNTTSGLTDTVKNQAVTLSMNGTVVEGKNADGDLVFKIAVDSSGNGTLTQYRAVFHDDTGDHDESGTSAAGLNAGTIGLTASLTDNDNDTASDLVDVSALFRFEDDGPLVDIAPASAALVVDESVGTGGSTEHEGGATNNDETAGGAPAGAIGYTTGSLIAANPTFDAGSDGEKSSSFTLEVTNTASGLVDTETNEAVELSETAGGVIEGRTETSDELVFTLSVDNSGVGTLTQYRAVKHNDNADHDENGAGEPAVLGAGTLKLVAELTDGDDDVDTDEIDISGLIRFEDDGPLVDIAAATAALVVDESVGTGGSTEHEGGATNNDETGSPGADIGYKTGSLIAANPTFDAGEDGEKSRDFALEVTNTASGLTDTATNAAVVLSETAGGVIEGRVTGSGELVFTLSVDDSGVGTLTQFRAVKHDDNADHDENGSGEPAVLSAGTVALIATLTDGDDDVDSEQIDISDLIRFEDDGPSITRNTTPVPSLATDDTYTIPDPITDSDGPTSFAGLFTSDFGSDGASATDDLVYAFDLTVDNGVDSGLNDTLTGQNILLRQTNSTTIEGYLENATTTVAFTLSLNADTGAVTQTQARAILHDQPGDSSETVASGDAESLNLASGEIRLTAAIKDGDGDTATASANVTGAFRFEDDGPQVTIDEQATIPDLVTDDTLITDNDGPKDFSGLFDFDPGADGYKGGSASTGVAYTFTITGYDPDAVTPVYPDSGLDDTLTGDNILLRINGSGEIEGFVESDDSLVAFTISVNASGQVSLEQARAIYHDDPSDPAETYANGDAQQLNGGASGLIKLKATITDGDDDSDFETVDITQHFFFEDAGPSGFTVQAAVLENSASGSDSGSIDFTPGDGNISNNFGNDGGKIVFDPALDGANSGLSSGFTPILYDVDDTGQILYGKAGVNTIFTITLDQANSSYEIEMDGEVDSISQVDFSSSGYEFVGGNEIWFGIVPNGQGTGNNDNPQPDSSEDVLITPINGDTVNTSGITGGIETGQDVDVGEGFRVDYVFDLTGAPPGGNYAQGQVNGHDFAGHWITNKATVSMRQSTGTTVRIKAFDDEGGPARDTSENDIVGDGNQELITHIAISYNNDASPLLTPTSTAQPVTVGGRSFTYKLEGSDVVITNVGGASGNSSLELTTTVAVYTGNGYTTLEVTNEGPNAFKFSGFGAAVSTSSPVNFAVPLLIIDGDGDTTPLTNLSVTLNPPASPPVVLDLDGDGVEFLGRDAGVAFDYDSDGLAEATGWAGADDGILVRDAGGDGLVTSATEFVFGDASTTDLQALASQYGDTLDNSDAGFASFAVWRDANSNGVSDAGEVVSLGDLGIASIGLVSDGAGYSAAGGDVVVHGEAAYLKADGSVGTLADASFATSQARSELRSQELAVSAGVAGILAAALVDEADASTIQAGLVVVDADADSASEISGATASGSESTDATASPELLDAGTDDAHPQPALSASTGDDEGSVEANLSDPIDHATVTLESAGTDPVSEVGSSQSLFVTAGSDSSDVMQGLLLLGGGEQPAPANDTEVADLGALQDALVLADSETFVDELTQGLGVTDSDPGSAADGENLAAILDADVSGDLAVLTIGHDFNQTVEDATAAAAA